MGSPGFRSEASQSRCAACSYEPLLYQATPSADQHPGGVREQAVALVEYFDGRLHRAMQQQLRSPIEEIGFAGIKFRRPLVLPYGFERITRFLFDVAEQVMQFGLIFLPGLLCAVSNACASVRARWY